MNLKHRQLISLIGIFLLACSLPVLLTLVINLPIFDEKAKPDLKLFQSRSKIERDDNAYLLLLAISAGPDENVEKLGLKMIDSIENASLDDNTIGQSIEEINRSYAGDLAASGKYIMKLIPCRARQDSRCFQRLIESKPSVSDHAVTTEILSTRYLAARELAHFDDGGDFNWNTPLPNYQLATLASLLVLHNNFASNTPQRLITEIKNNVAFWSMLLRDSKTIVGKMVAVNNLWENLSAASYLIRTRGINESQAMALEEIFGSFDKDLLDIREAFVGEFSTALNVGHYWTRDPANESLYLKLTTQKIASLNLQYRHAIAPLLILASTPASEFAQQSKAMMTTRYALSASPTLLYNLGGKLSLSRNIDNIFASANYIARVHDINGMFTLLQLQIDLWKDESNLAGSDAVKQNKFERPVNGQKIKFDKEEGSLSFKCFDQRFANCKIYL